MYTPPSHYTDEQLRQFEIDDLIRDAEAAERQAENGPFYPNVTAESLRAYAKGCREQAARKKNDAGR